MEKLDAELDHHLRIAGRATSAYIEEKRQFWESVLELVRRHNGGRIGRPVLEIGNGPFGAFLALDRRDTVCVDPLNGRYREIFPHFKALESRFIESGIESAGTPGRFSTIISYNSLDHVDDAERAVAKMAELSRKGAVLLVGVDYYRSGLLRSFMHAFRRHIDTPHPHHFLLGELEELLGRHFEILEITDNSRFRVVEEGLPERKTGFIDEFMARPAGALAGAAYRGAYLAGKKLGMGGREANLGIKKMAVFVLRKERATE
ncbi:MAG TPA: hypothetical protein VLD37_05745 [Candidatus Bilamarchaeum sp.]|nr:hypothetical protein [Candidatus Bilamarchaeum sp.]